MPYTAALIESVALLLGILWLHKFLHCLRNSTAYNSDKWLIKEAVLQTMICIQYVNLKAAMMGYGIVHTYRLLIRNGCGSTHSNANTDNELG